MFDLRVESIGSTTVNLTWKNEDLRATNYTYQIEIERNASLRNESSDTTSAVIINLEPGTWYRFTVYPVAPDNKTEGEPKNTSLYTSEYTKSIKVILSIQNSCVFCGRGRLPSFSLLPNSATPSCRRPDWPFLCCPSTGGQRSFFSE